MHLSTISRSIKSHMCRFCMKKHADRNANPGSYIPRYCPLELYSHNPERVGAGLYALWDDWIESGGTINMLRIFVDGKVLNPTQVTPFFPCSFRYDSPYVNLSPFGLVGFLGRGACTTNRPRLPIPPRAFFTAPFQIRGKNYPHSDGTSCSSQTFRAPEVS